MTFLIIITIITIALIILGVAVKSDGTTIVGFSALFLVAVFGGIWGSLGNYRVEYGSVTYLVNRPSQDYVLLSSLDGTKTIKIDKFADIRAIGDKKEVLVRKETDISLYGVRVVDREVFDAKLVEGVDSVPKVE